MDVRFYETAAGGDPVREHLRRMPEDQRITAGRMIRIVQEQDLNAPGVHKRQFRGKLWELRAKHQRIFYVVVPGPTVWLLHAYDKNTTKAPKDEIDLAQRRMREVLARR